MESDTKIFENWVEKYLNHIIFCISIFIYIGGLTLVSQNPLEAILQGSALSGLILIFRIVQVRKTLQEKKNTQKFHDIKIDLDQEYQNKSTTSLLEYRSILNYKSKKEAIITKYTSKINKLEIKQYHKPKKKDAYQQQIETLKSTLDIIKVELYKIRYQKIPTNFCYSRVSQDFNLNTKKSYTSIIIVSLIFGLLMNTFSLTSISVSLVALANLIITIPFFIVQYYLAIRDGDIMAEQDYSLLVKNKQFLIDYSKINIDKESQNNV